MSDKDKIGLEEFRAIIDEGKVECEVCGKRMHSVVPHITEEHALTPKQYREKYEKAKLASRLVTELIKTFPRGAQPSSALDDYVEEFRFPLPAMDLEKQDEVRTSLKEMAGGLPDVPEDLLALVPAVDPTFRFDSTVRPIGYGIMTSKNVYVSGPTGCGKTSGVRQVFASMGEPIRRVNMNGEVTYRNFIGQRGSDGTKTTFEKGFLPKAMIGDGNRGYTLLVDEIDYTPPPIAAVMNPVLEDERILYLPDTCEEVKARPGFNVIATSNTGGRGDTFGTYTGTEILNAAFLDRFPIKLTMDYIPQLVEIGLLEALHPNEPHRTVETYVKAAGEVRQAFKQGESSITFSTRKLREFFEMKQVLGEQLALGTALLNWTDRDDRQALVEILRRTGVDPAVLDEEEAD
jgi:cobaltochelatase CobS